MVIIYPLSKTSFVSHWSRISSFFSPSFLHNEDVALFISFENTVEFSPIYRRLLLLFRARFRAVTYLVGAFHDSSLQYIATC